MSDLVGKRVGVLGKRVGVRSCNPTFRGAGRNLAHLVSLIYLDR